MERSIGRSRAAAAEPPAVRDVAWVAQSDRPFMLARLEAPASLRARSGSPHAGRRVALDLTGLPPEPAEVEAFVKDTSPGSTRSTSISCSRRRTTASTAAATGSTPPATPTRTASTSTTIARCGRTAIG